MNFETFNLLSWKVLIFTVSLEVSERRGRLLFLTMNWTSSLLKSFWPHMDKKSIVSSLSIFVKKVRESTLRRFNKSSRCQKMENFAFIVLSFFATSDPSLPTVTSSRFAPNSSSFRVHQQLQMTWITVEKRLVGPANGRKIF